MCCKLIFGGKTVASVKSLIQECTDYLLKLKTSEKLDQDATQGDVWSQLESISNELSIQLVFCQKDL